MRNFLVVFLLFLNLTPAVLALDTSHCVVLSEFSYGNNCGSKDSMQVKLKNLCNQETYQKLCLKKRDGGWSCFLDTRLGVNSERIYYTCHGDSMGTYKFASCTGGKEECGYQP